MTKIIPAAVCCAALFAVPALAQRKAAARPPMPHTTTMTSGEMDMMHACAAKSAAARAQDRACHDLAAKHPDMMKHWTK